MGHGRVRWPGADAVAVAVADADADARPDARPDRAHEEVFDLLVELEADDHALDFPVLYASARDGWAC